MQLALSRGTRNHVDLIGNGTLALLQTHEQFDTLQNRTLIKSAVEELFRLHGPVENDAVSH